MLHVYDVCTIGMSAKACTVCQLHESWERSINWLIETLVIELITRVFTENGPATPTPLSKHVIPTPCNSEECFKHLDLICFLLNCHFFWWSVTFVDQIKAMEMGHRCSWWMEAVRMWQGLAQRGRNEGRVRELGKTGHEPMETIMMLMHLELIHYTSIQDRFGFFF